ncbi:MAG: uracil-DNA glycosylase [Panacagrimonas sp.]
MDPARRKTYLKALGVEVWVPRARRGEDATPSTVTEPAAREYREAIIKEPLKPVIRATPALQPGSRIAEPRPLEPVPTDWPGLRAMVKDCQRCKLCATRTQTVFGVGPENASLMVVGEGPGADEDAQGEPFVGRAGKLLDEMLAAIGRSRRADSPDKSVFIANVVKCRPPGNRDPEVDEVEACRPYLEQQIRLVRPKLIVGLGRIAAQRLLATDQPLSKLRGPMHAYGETRTPLFVTYHPAYLLRSPREKAKSWEDLKKIWRFLRSA